MTTRFHPRDSLGAHPAATIAAYLQSIDDFEGAAAFVQGGVAAQTFLAAQAYKATGMVVGHIAPLRTTTQAPITPSTGIQADPALTGRRIKIALDKFYVHSYPGRGTHTVLCEFAGKNQVAHETEELRHALRFDANDRSSASQQGTPIFLGITVGADGISFEGRTVNVRSSTDDTILQTLDSPVFKSGLSLIAAAQPALKPLAGLATAAVKAIAGRDKNKQVHTFNLGLDFSGSATSSRLRLGTYVVVQTDDESWSWRNFHWDADNQSLRLTATDTVPEVNYMAFSVSEYVGT